MSGARSYYQHTKRFRLLPSRPDNAASELRMIVEAEGAEGLSAKTIRKIRNVIDWLEDDVIPEVERVSGVKLSP